MHYRKCVGKGKVRYRRRIFTYMYKMNFKNFTYKQRTTDCSKFQAQSFCWQGSNWRWILPALRFRSLWN